MKFFLLLLLFCSRLAFATDAASCIQLGTTAKGQSMKNTCAEQIVMFWCHDLDQQGSRSQVCGAGNWFYTLSSTLKPGATNDNPYSLPANAHISYGACIGDYASYKYTDKQGGYLCKPPKGSSGDTATMISTSGAPTADEACKRARQLAAAHGAAGECDCQARGKVHICRVPSSGPKPDGSAIGAGKEQIQELAKCKPEDKDCQSRPSNGGSGSGRRG